MAVEERKTVDQKNAEYNKGKAVAVVIAGLVYVGVVLAATIVFISFILSAFPSKAYASRAIMTFAGLLVGASMISFPITLHLWAVEKFHRGVTIALYFLEMVIVAVNTIVAFSHLLAKNAGVAAPEWAVLYEPFSIGAIVYTLAAWGIVFLMDPEHKRKAKDLQNEEKLKQAVADKETEFLDSIEGEDVIANIAALNIQHKYNTDRFAKGKRHWGSKGETPQLPDNNSGLSLPAPRNVTIPEELYKRLLEGGNSVPFPVEQENHKNPTNPPRN